MAVRLFDTAGVIPYVIEVHGESEWPGLQAALPVTRGRCFRHRHSSGRESYRVLGYDLRAVAACQRVLGLDIDCCPTCAASAGCACSARSEHNSCSARVRHELDSAAPSHRASSTHRPKRGRRATVQAALTLPRRSATVTNRCSTLANGHAACLQPLWPRPQAPSRHHHFPAAPLNSQPARLEHSGSVQLILSAMLPHDGQDPVR